MKGSRQISTESGMSQQRVIQFARDNGVQFIGNAYIFTEDDERKFYERIGQLGNKSKKPRRTKKERQLN